MDGYFGAVSRRDIVMDIFYGTDYHSHLGTRRGGMAIMNDEYGFQRKNTQYREFTFQNQVRRCQRRFHRQFGNRLHKRQRSAAFAHKIKPGTYAIITVGNILNKEQLMQSYLSFSGGHFDAMSGGKINATEIVCPS